MDLDRNEVISNEYSSDDYEGKFLIYKLWYKYVVVNTKFIRGFEHSQNQFLPHKYTRKEVVSENMQKKKKLQKYHQRFLYGWVYKRFVNLAFIYSMWLQENSYLTKIPPHLQISLSWWEINPSLAVPVKNQPSEKMGI